VGREAGSKVCPKKDGCCGSHLLGFTSLSMREKQSVDQEDKNLGENERICDEKDARKGGDDRRDNDGKQTESGWEKERAANT
jgi:hypothetical protein